MDAVDQLGNGSPNINNPSVNYVEFSSLVENGQPGVQRRDTIFTATGMPSKLASEKNAEPANPQRNNPQNNSLDPQKLTPSPSGKKDHYDFSALRTILNQSNNRNIDRNNRPKKYLVPGEGSRTFTPLLGSEVAPQTTTNPDKSPIDGQYSSITHLLNKNKPK